jgi:predicted enzyme related to lactoylglutathione lyase
MAAAGKLIGPVDFVGVATRDLERAVAFYGDTLGLRCSVRLEGAPFAEFETDNVTFSVIESERMGLPFAINPTYVALHVDDVAAARAELESRGVAFEGDIFDTGVCHMAFFADPDGNRLMLHHRYAPRVTRE